MLDQSVLAYSGQRWKLAVAVLALLVGSIAPIFPASGIGWTAGTVIAIGGYLFGLLAIRCANCRSPWFWEAAKDAGLYAPLFKRSRCPGCGHEFKT